MESLLRTVNSNTRWNMKQFKTFFCFRGFSCLCSTVCWTQKFVPKLSANGGHINTRESSPKEIQPTACLLGSTLCSLPPECIVAVVQLENLWALLQVSWFKKCLRQTYFQLQNSYMISVMVRIKVCPSFKRLNYKPTIAMITYIWIKSNIIRDQMDFFYRHTYRANGIWPQGMLTQILTMKIPQAINHPIPVQIDICWERSLKRTESNCSPGLSNFKPQEGHIIPRDLAEGHNRVYMCRNEGLN